MVACPINNISYLKKFRKELRNKLTPAEAKLWTYLQNSTLDGRKFRRHHSVANFILDFYCPAESLAIELDGEIHYNPTQAEYDRERDLFLNAKGIKVIRFENKIVFQNPHGLLQAIKNNFGWKNATTLKSCAAQVTQEAPPRPPLAATPPCQEGSC